MSDLPKELWLTFEGGLHVGVFRDPAAAERLNDLRRRKKKAEPVTARYVLAEHQHEWIDISTFDDVSNGRHRLTCSCGIEQVSTR